MAAVADCYRVSVGLVHKSVSLARKFFAEEDPKCNNNCTGIVSGGHSSKKNEKRAERLAAFLAPRPRGGAREKRTHVGPAHVTFLRELMSRPESAFLALSDIAARLVREFKDLPSVSRSTISRLLRGPLKLSRKFAQVKNARRYTEANQKRYAEFVRSKFRYSGGVPQCLSLRRSRGRRSAGLDLGTRSGGSPWPSATSTYRASVREMERWWSRIDPSRLFFTDESGFNLDDTRRKRGWAPRGERLLVVGDQDKGVNHTLVVVVGGGEEGGVVARTWKPTGGAGGPGRGKGFTRSDFLAFLRDGFARAVRRHRAKLPAPRRGETLFLVLDNASIHKGAAVAEALAEIGVEPIYLPPYSPELNPCELVFGHVKGALRCAAESARGRQRPQPSATEQAAAVPAVNNVRLANKPRGSRRGKSLTRAQSEWLRGRVFHHLSAITPDLVRSYYDHCGWRRCMTKP